MGQECLSEPQLQPLPLLSRWPLPPESCLSSGQDGQEKDGVPPTGLTPSQVGAPEAVAERGGLPQSYKWPRQGGGWLGEVSGWRLPPPPAEEQGWGTFTRARGRWCCPQTALLA